MEEKEDKTKNSLYPLIISIAIFLIFTFLYSQTTLFDGLENGATDYFRFEFREPPGGVQSIYPEEGKAVEYMPNPRARKDLVIIGIDENTLRHFSDKYDQNWPFDWNIHAKVARYLGSGNATAIFFDIMFLDHKPYKEDLADAIRGAKNAFLDYPFETSETQTSYEDIEERIKLINNATFKVNPNDNEASWVKEIVPPIPLLMRASEGIGFANVEPDPDHVNRKMPLIIKFNVNYIAIYNDILRIVNRINGLPLQTINDNIDNNSESVLGIKPEHQAEILKRVAKKYNLTVNDDLDIKDFPTLSHIYDYINNKTARYYPNIDLLLVMQYFGITIDDVEIKIGEYIKLKNLPDDKMTIPNEEREIIIPVDKKGKMDINFVGGHKSYTNYPYYYFYRDGKIDDKAFKDKIIFIAAYSSTGLAYDKHKSPYGELFGIDHHVNAVNTILEQDFIVKLNEWQNIILLFIISLILGYLLARLKIVWSIVFALGFTLVFIITGIVLFHVMNLIYIFATPLIQTGLTFAVIVAYRVLTEEKEKRQIRQTFSKLVAKSVVDELLKNPDEVKLGGDKKIITVLFSDIRGFTSLSEKMTPEGLVEHLNEYLEAMTNIVMKYEGTLDKYVGDEIMAFWGAPIPQDEHALLACKAAVEMMEVLNKMNENWKSLPEPKEPLYIGIGLNTGDMVVALMGSSSRMDYTLMGDNVNLGARLEGTNKVYGTNIIISEFTYEQVKDSVVTRELDLIRVKGKELPVKIYELVDIKE